MGRSLVVGVSLARINIGAETAYVAGVRPSRIRCERQTAKPLRSPESSSIVDSDNDVVWPGLLASRLGRRYKYGLTRPQWESLPAYVKAQIMASFASKWAGRFWLALCATVCVLTLYFSWFVSRMLGRAGFYVASDAAFRIASKNQALLCCHTRSALQHMPPAYARAREVRTPASFRGWRRAERILMSTSRQDF